jgi:hypothetical protein
MYSTVPCWPVAEFWDSGACWLVDELWNSVECWAVAFLRQCRNLTWSDAGSGAFLTTLVKGRTPTSAAYLKKMATVPVYSNSALFPRKCCLQSALRSEVFGPITRTIFTFTFTNLFLILIALAPRRIPIWYPARSAMESSLQDSWYLWRQPCAWMPSLHCSECSAQPQIPIVSCNWRIGCQWNPLCQLCFYRLY